MALDFTSATGYLFNRLGKIFGGWKNVETHQRSVLPNIATVINGQYAANPEMIPNLQNQLVTGQTSAGQIKGELVNEATTTLINMVQTDNPQPSANLQMALPELIRQMVAAGATVKANTVSGSVAALGTNNGNGACIVSVIDGDGKQLDNVYPEVIQVRCQSDSQPGTGNLAVGSESFLASGQQSITKTDFRWPTGSNNQTFIACANPDVDGGANNLLTNGSFETFTIANTPDGWTIIVGTAGVTVQSTATAYNGFTALAIVGTAGAIRTRLAQTLRTSGTPGAIQPLTRYAVGVYLRMSTASVAGTVRIAMRDGTTDGAAVIGGASITVAASALTTGYVLHTFQFNTPAALPDNLYLVIELTTAIDTGTSVYIDALAMVKMVQHNHGPLLAIFRGNVKYIRGDGFNVTISNDRASLFQEFFNRAFNTDQLDLLLPTDGYGAETIPNSLVSA